MWVQIERLRTAPALVYVEGRNAAHAFDRDRAAHGRPPPTGHKFLESDSITDYPGCVGLEPIARWLHDYEYETPFQGTDVWLANELEKGAVFMPLDE